MVGPRTPAVPSIAASEVQFRLRACSSVLTKKERFTQFLCGRFQDERFTTVDTKKRERRFHELRGVSFVSRRMLEAVYAITFHRHPPVDMPASEVIQAILDAEFPPRPENPNRRPCTE